MVRLESERQQARASPSNFCLNTKENATQKANISKCRRWRRVKGSFFIAVLQTYISFHLLERPPGQHSSGMGLQEDDSFPLAPQLLPGYASSDTSLEQDGRLPLPTVLDVELAGTDLSLEPRKTVLDLERIGTN